KALKKAAAVLSTTPEEVPEKAQALLQELSEAHKVEAKLRSELAAGDFERQLANLPQVTGTPVLTAVLPEADVDTLRLMADRFRQKVGSGVAVLRSEE